MLISSLFIQGVNIKGDNIGDEREENKRKKISHCIGYSFLFFLFIEDVKFKVEKFRRGKDKKRKEKNSSPFCSLLLYLSKVSSIKGGPIGEEMGEKIRKNCSPLC